MRSALLFAVMVSMSSVCLAADRPTRQTRTEEFWQPASTAYTTAMVDELLLTSERCSRSNDCIAPRIAPVRHDRIVTYRSVRVRVDPRFAQE